MEPVLGPAPACPAGCGRPARWYGFGRGFPCQVCADAAHARRLARTRRTASVRRPPRPPHERVAGACSMCGTRPLPGRRRSWCSDECVDLWRLATDSTYQRLHLVGLHGPACWACGASTAEQETREVEVRLAVDHRRPLWLLTATEATELRWWLPFNLQLLCEPCHRDKTRREAALRARIRREDPTRLR